MAIKAGDFVRSQIYKFDSNGNFITKWGYEGTGDPEEYFYIRDLAADTSGNIYAVNLSYYRIYKFDNNGNFITKWGEAGSGDGQFRNLSNLTTDSAKNVYVIGWSIWLTI